MTDRQCEHQAFRCAANIGRLTREEGGPVTGFSAEIKIECAECGVAFRFIGLQAGNSHREPRVSIDGTELRAPIKPASHERIAPRAHYEFPGSRQQ